MLIIFFAIKLSVPFGIKQYLFNNKNISSSNSSTSLRRQKTLLFQFFLQFGGTCTAFVHYTYTGYLF